VFSAFYYLWHNRSRSESVRCKHAQKEMNELRCQSGGTKKNEKNGTKGSKENEVGMRVRQPKPKPTCSRRPEEAVLALPARLGQPSRSTKERPADFVIRNPPPYVGAYGVLCGDFAFHQNAPRVAKALS
jgi:hypothetical protein